MACAKQNPACLADIEQIALEKLDRNARDYFQSGANHEFSLRENRKAFDRLQLRPRFLLRDVSKRYLETTVLGHKISFPVGISPSAMQKMAHPDGEIATAQAAGQMGTLMILSTISTTSIEDVAKEAPNTLKWFQLYIYKDRNITAQLVHRAERAGFKALVLTVDTPMFGTRLNDVRNKFTLPPHLRMANFEANDPKANRVCASESESGLAEYSKSLFDPSLTWKDVSWLKQITKLPIVVKGILTAEDAKLAIEYGASAILVSNHGARQLDGVPATIEVLPEIVKAVKGRCEVYLDGGIRTGTDVLKALALGARAVFIGRPNIWGLAFNGANGAKLVLEILKSELDIAMALAGCASVSDVTSSLVVHKNYYSNL